MRKSHLLQALVSLQIVWLYLWDGCLDLDSWVRVISFTLFWLRF